MEGQTGLYRWGRVLIVAVIIGWIGTPLTAKKGFSPILQAVTSHSVYVLVETDETGPVQVIYGTASLERMAQDCEPPKPTTANPPTFVHHIKLSGLDPQTIYRYQVVRKDDESSVHRFRTAALTGSKFRFAWMADCRTGIEVHDRIAGRIREASPDISLYGGDLCRSYLYGSWRREYFTPNERALIAETPFFLATGNHEGWAANTLAFTHAPESASGSPAYFSFNYGDVHFLAVNNELSIKPGSQQYRFIERDLAASDRGWVVVFAHRPAYCAGGHGEDSDMVFLSKKLFKPAGVDLVIAGHSHFYQRNEVDGIQHLIIGSAGAPLATPGKADYTVKSSMAFNYAIADAGPEKLELAVYNEQGKVLDKIVLRN